MLKMDCMTLKKNDTTRERNKEEMAFYRRLCWARYFEGVVASILELSGYRVFPYGQENLLPTLRETFRKNSSTPETTEERLRANPDLLVVSPETDKSEARTRLVEVKFRNWSKPENVRLAIIKYRRHWPDALLVVIIPAADVFYAQTIQQLNPRKRTFDLTKDFQPLDQVFQRVSQETLSTFAEDVHRFTATLENNNRLEPTLEELAWQL